MNKTVIQEKGSTGLVDRDLRQVVHAIQMRLREEAILRREMDRIEAIEEEKRARYRFD